MREDKEQSKSDRIGLNDVLWRPSEYRLMNSHMWQFIRTLNEKYSLKVSHYEDLHQWSIENPLLFWKELSLYFPILWEGTDDPICADLEFSSYGWYPNKKLNFAENLLSQGKDADTAIRFVHESGMNRSMSYQELRQQVSLLQQALRPYIQPGDVLACYMPNIPETVISMLATSSLGGVFTSTSCDFGVEGVMDRFGQSKPKVLVAVRSYQYNGKTHSLMDKISVIAQKIKSIEKIVLVDLIEPAEKNGANIENSVDWNEFLSAQSPQKISYLPVPFSSPLYIMYSSGTTGKPKCIVHSVGGTLLQHIKELGLHTNLTAEKNIFYFTTCGWMMWNWLMSSLFFGSTIVLYEGSPGFPSLNEFFKIIDREKIHIFGTSPKFLKALQDNGWDKNTDLDSLETLLSTGAPLLPEQFDFVYERVKSDVQLSSISGGTDIIGCFMLGSPISPVRRGEIQVLGLAMDVVCFDEKGEVLNEAEGELVCRQSFPSRPIYFLNDPKHEKINEAYFSKYPGVWHHGDFILITKSKGVMVFGRSDATLNPGGVRIGTAEIYRQTEALDYLEDSICVGKNIQGDVDVLLFVQLKTGESLTEERVREIKTLILKNTTPRHVPREIYQIEGIPYTRSGKKMEMAVSRLINGKELTNLEAVSNPESLEAYKTFI